MVDAKIGESDIITISRRFDISSNMTREWFKLYIAELKTYLDGDTHLDCYVRHLSDIENRRSFRDLHLWTQHVLADWDDIAETEIWNYRGPCRRALCDHCRLNLVIEFASKDLSSIEESLRSIVESLTLKPSPREPYLYRRSSLEFEVGSWRPDLFATGVERIAAFLGGNPAVSDLYVKTHDGDIEKLIPFYALKEFLQFVGQRASRFGEASVRLQARSIGVGIAVTPDHKKLRIRTTLPPEDLEQIHAAWPEQLGLRPTKAQDSGSDVVGVAPAPSESQLLKYAVPVLVAFITTISTAGLVSLHKAVWPDYSLVITSPPSKQGVTTLRSGAIPISWYLRPVQASFHSDRKDVPAAVRIYGSAGIQNSLNARPPTVVRLRPGSYVIEVDALDAPPAQVQVVVNQSSSRKTSQAHAPH